MDQFQRAGPATCRQRHELCTQRSQFPSDTSAMIITDCNDCDYADLNYDNHHGNGCDLDYKIGVI